MLYERWLLELWHGDYDVAAEILTPDFTGHWPDREVEGRDLSEAAVRRAIQLSATKYCPVSAMVAAGDTVIHHRFRIRSEGERPYEEDDYYRSYEEFVRATRLAA